MDTEKRIRHLTKKISYHNHRYYMLDSPEISGYEYDMMMRELIELEEEHPEYIVEYKIDGLSVALLYQDGILTRGAARGGGLLYVINNLYKYDGLCMA